MVVLFPYSVVPGVVTLVGTWTTWIRTVATLSCPPVLQGRWRWFSGTLQVLCDFSRLHRALLQLEVDRLLVSVSVAAAAAAAAVSAACVTIVALSMFELKWCGVGVSLRVCVCVCMCVCVSASCMRQVGRCARGVVLCSLCNPRSLSL